MKDGAYEPIGPEDALGGEEIIGLEISNAQCAGAGDGDARTSALSEKEHDPRRTLANEVQ